MSELNDQESEFERLVRETPFDDAPRPEHQDALRREMLAKLDSAVPLGSEIPSQSVGRHLMKLGRDIMSRRVPRLILMVAVALVMATLWLIVSGHQTTAQAFAKLAEPLLTAKTAHFQMRVKTDVAAFTKAFGPPSRDVNFPDMFQGYFLAPARYRTEMPNKMYTIADFTTGGRMMTVMPIQRQAMVVKFKGEVTKGPKDKNFQNYFQELRNLLSNSRNAKESQYQRIGEKEIDGRHAIGFRYDSPSATVTLWGDPATGAPVQIDSVYSGTPHTEVVMNHFEINVDLQTSLFDLTPPTGYTVRSFDVDVAAPTEQTLVEAFKAASDLGDGDFPTSLDTMGIMQLIMKRTLKSVAKQPSNKPGAAKDAKAQAGAKGPSDEEIQRMMQQSMTIGRGFGFALELPESADAHYAGKGAKRGTKDRPIFWYKPVGSENYHVIFANLSVQTAEKAPQVSGAVRLAKPATPNAK